MLNPNEITTKNILAFGISHHSADASARGKVAFSPEEILSALPESLKTLDIQECALLSTCNRTEFYAVRRNLSRLPDIYKWLQNRKHFTEQELSRAHFHLYIGDEAIEHLYQVACGLDSLILGEPQILGQLKQTHRLSKAAGTVGSILDRLFQSSFAVAKEVRYSTTIGAHAVSVASAGVKLTHQFFDDHNRRTALIIGAGETAELAAKYLQDTKIKRLIIANRTLTRAQKLAESYLGFAITLEQIPIHLHEADIIIGAARSELPLLHYEVVKESLKKRRYALQVLIDLAIPNNFASNIDQLEQAFLYGIDDLEQIIDDNLKARQAAALEAKSIIRFHVDDFITWLLSKPQQQIVRHMRENANRIREALLSEAYRRLSHGDDPAEVMEQMSKKLMNKLLHNPSELIHAIPPDHKDWLAIVADTFKSSSH